MHVLDHVFVFCAPGAPERRRLLEHGLAAGVERRHEGQGTANVCFALANAYLELLWIEDEGAARSPLVRPLGLHERASWASTDASPFGVCVRPEVPGTPPEFATWPYRPDYLPPGMSIDMAGNSGVLGEPLLFAVDRPYVPFGPAHALSAARLVAATITVRELAPRSLLRDVRVPGLTLLSGTAPLLELELAPANGHVLDLRPHLPLVLRC